MLLPGIIKMMAGRYLERRGWRKGSAGGVDLCTAMLRRPDLAVETVIDVGASNGSWSERMMRYFPRANYLLVEAQREAHGTALERFKGAHANVRYELCAAGDHDGEIQFDVSNPLGGAASKKPFARNNIVVRMAAIDTLIRRSQLQGPFLLKMDTHGFEVPILEGAREVLSQASLLIIEAYNFTLCPGALRFYELCDYLEKRGFRCIDMFDLMIRPTDNALWQMDMVFLPSSHSVFQSNVYQPE